MLVLQPSQCWMWTRAEAPREFQCDSNGHLQGRSLGKVIIYIQALVRNHKSKMHWDIEMCKRRSALSASWKLWDLTGIKNCTPTLCFQGAWSLKPRTWDEIRVTIAEKRLQVLVSFLEQASFYYLWGFSVLFWTQKYEGCLNGLINVYFILICLLRAWLG